MKKENVFPQIKPGFISYKNGKKIHDDFFFYLLHGNDLMTPHFSTNITSFLLVICLNTYLSY